MLSLVKYSKFQQRNGFVENVEQGYTTTTPDVG